MIAYKKEGVEDFEKIVKSLHFLHLTSINWLVLKIRLCQNSRDDNLCKNDAQVGIYLKSLLIKSNPVICLLIAQV